MTDYKEKVLKSMNEEYALIDSMLTYPITREQQIKLAGYKQAIIDLEQILNSFPSKRKLTVEQFAVQYQTIWNVLYKCGAGALGPIEPVVRKIQDALNANTLVSEVKISRFEAIHKENGSTEIYIDGVFDRLIAAGVTWAVQHWFFNNVSPLCLDKLGYGRNRWDREADMECGSLDEFDQPNAKLKECKECGSIWMEDPPAGEDVLCSINEVGCAYCGKMRLVVDDKLKTEITKQAIEDWYKDTAGTTRDEYYKRDILNWLDQRGE